MRRLARLFAVTLLATPMGATIGLAAPAPKGFDPTAPAGGRILLTCTGSMGTAERKPEFADTVMASGTVDLDRGIVTGFGIGSAEIVAATPEAIAFGDSPEIGVIRVFSAAGRTAPMPKGGALPPPQVAGNFNRTTGVTRIIVHAADAPDRVLISMDFHCRMAPAPETR